jgi:hypothetical protein
MRRIRNHITSAHVIAMLALFVAMGGTGYAALKLPKNSVGSKQIKKNAVTSTKVKNGSLKKGDFAAGQLPAGAVGPRGPAGANGTNGPAGPQGEATGFARVQADGALEPSTTPVAQNRGVDGVSIQHTAATGIYCFGSLPFTPASAVGTLDDAQLADNEHDKTVGVSVQRGANLNGCDADHQQLRVKTFDVSAAALADQRFYIWFEK